MVNELENLLRQLQVNGVNIDNGSLQYVYDNKLPKWLKAKAYASGIPTTFQELRQKVQEQLVIATELDQSNKKKHVAVNVTSYFQQVTIQPQMPFQQQMTYQPIQQFQQPVYQQIPVYQINHEHWETAEEEGKPKDLPENEKYFIHDMPKDSIEPENDEDNTSKLLIEEKMEENMDENILAFCQDLPKDKLDIFQAEDYGKSTFQAENDENSTYLYEIKDDIEEPSMNEPVKWKMTNLNPGRIKNGEEKILYETMDSNGKFLPDERIKCKMKPKAVEDTVTKDNSNIWMEKETNPPVTKAEKCWKQIKKKIKADFGKFKHAWKKKQQNLNLQWKKKNQQTSGFKKEAKEKENELIKNSEKWKLKKIDLWKQPNELIKKARIKMKQFLKAGEGLRQAQFSIPNLSKWSEMKFRHTNPDVQKEMIWTTPTPKQKLEWQLFTDEFSILHRQNGLELKPEVNDVIKDEEVPRGSWKMGRITKLQKS
uniref:DUF5641 domain-containing protein n=1 Tax=Panagrolaimus sp. JU765 TaxID=591449 RepID=A0AC34QEB5_9BILA